MTPTKRAARKARPVGFQRFYTPELSVLLFWIFTICVVIGTPFAVVAAPSRALFLIASAVLSVLFVRIVLEVTAVLLQIHGKLDELCEMGRRAEESANAEAERTRVAERLAAERARIAERAAAKAKS